MKKFRFRNASIARKIYVIMAIMAVFTVLELIVISYSLHTLSAVRAYVGGEGLWSKAQKDAAYHLLNYAQYHHSEDYEAFQKWMTVPLGDRKARIELEKHDADRSVARDGFLVGRNHPDDVEGLINVFQRFRKIYYIDKAISIWTQAEPYIDQLLLVADSLHQEIASGHPDQAKVNHLVGRINQINQGVTVLEDDFSYVLGEGSRWLENLVLWALISLIVCVAVIGLSMALVVNNTLRKGLEVLSTAAKRISKGDLFTPTQKYKDDEIGTVVDAFNYMTLELDKSVSAKNASEAQYRSLFDNSSDLIQVLSPQGYFQYVNPAWYKATGYTSEDIKGLNLFDILLPEHWDACRDRLQEIVQGGKPGSVETIFMTKAGQALVLEGSISCNYVDNHPDSIQCFLRDISERKQIQEHLIQAKEKAEHSERLKQGFLANMSHEIRTPINAILGFTQLLKDTDLNGDQQDSLKAIELSSVNLLSLVNDILDFSKIEAGKIHFENAPVSLREMFHSAIVVMQPRAGAREVELSESVEQGIPDVLNTDAVRLNQIIMNLLSNAIKFTEKGTVKMSASLLREEGDRCWILIQVSDTGIGIPEDKKSVIFDSFSQVSSGNNRLYGGTGLGLSIVKQLVELQGGVIEVESQESQGSTFSVTLPMQRIKKASKPNEKALQRSLELSTSSYFDEHHKHTHILLVEDNKMNQLLAVKLLTKWGFTVTTADNGRLAVEAMKNNTYELVIMDIQMPEMDGHEATRQIRQELKSTVPILAMTAHAMSGEWQKCLDSGMNAYISKPFNLQELFNMILQLVPVAKENGLA